MSSAGLRQEDAPWEGMEIARWLIAKGCPMKGSGPDGRTLLHIATEADGAAFELYLLDHGVDASTPGGFGLPALGSAGDEQIAMILLEAGTVLAKIDDADYSFPTAGRGTALDAGVGVAGCAREIGLDPESFFPPPAPGRKRLSTRAQPRSQHPDRRSSKSTTPS